MAKEQANKPASDPATPPEQPPVPAAAPILKKACVLSAFPLNGVTYQPGQIIEADADVIAGLGAQVDAHPDAVAYRESLG